MIVSTRFIRRVASAAALTAALTAAIAHPAGALPAGFNIAPGGANSNGVGFCLSQVAQDPLGTVGQPSLGAGIHQIANSAPGAVSAGIAGDRYPTCGGPGT